MTTLLLALVTIGAALLAGLARLILLLLLAALFFIFINVLLGSRVLGTRLLTIHVFLQGFFQSFTFGLLLIGTFGGCMGCPGVSHGKYKRCGLIQPPRQAQ